MTVTDERLDQIARNLLADAIKAAIREACATHAAQHRVLAVTVDDFDVMSRNERDALVARFDAALRRVKAELIQEGN